MGKRCHACGKEPKIWKLITFPADAAKAQLAIKKWKDSHPHDKRKPVQSDNVYICSCHLHDKIKVQIFMCVSRNSFFFPLCFVKESQLIYFKYFTTNELSLPNYVSGVNFFLHIGMYSQTILLTLNKFTKQERELSKSFMAAQCDKFPELREIILNFKRNKIKSRLLHCETELGNLKKKIQELEKRIFSVESLKMDEASLKDYCNIDRKLFDKIFNEIKAHVIKSSSTFFVFFYLESVSHCENHLQ